MNTIVTAFLYIISGTPDAPVVSIERMPVAKCHDEAAEFNYRRRQAQLGITVQEIGGQSWPRAICIDPRAR